MSRSGLTIAGWGLAALGLVLVLIGAFSDPTVQIAGSYSAYGGYTEASRSVNFHKMFNALGCIVIGGFGFVSGAIFLAAASLHRTVGASPATKPDAASTHQGSAGASAERPASADANSKEAWGGIAVIGLIILGLMIVAVAVTLFTR